MENRGLYVARRALRWLGAALWAGGLATAPGAAAAASEARVDVVQWPAWIERDGRRTPAQPGAELRPHDRLLTGRDARLVIRLADGSAVKLGEQAELGLEALGRRDGVLQAAIDVGKGAFRFTTGLFGKVLGRREVKVRVATLTLGIRGTDVWGKSSAEGDRVLLLEGRVAVAHAGAPEQELATPLETLLAPPGGAVERRTANAAQVAAWARETEIDPGRPAGRRGGRHAATVVVAESEPEALALRDRLIAAGYPVRLRLLDGTRIALRVEGFAAAREAGALAAEARRILAAP